MATEMPAQTDSLDTSGPAAIGRAAFGETEFSRQARPARETSPDLICHNLYSATKFYQVQYAASLFSCENCVDKNIKFHEDIYELGFPETLRKYTGQSFEELYESFNTFILDNPTPPEGFFPEEPLNELVDFWSINSG